jgi:aromatic-L-amino-acid decarboxylase
VDFELDGAQRRELVEHARQLTEHLIAAWESAPMFAPTSDSLLSDLLELPGEDGRPVESVLAALSAAAQCGWDKSSGGDLAYIPNGGLYSGEIAAWLAASVHAFTAAAFEAPALVALEESVLRWMADIIGMPSGAEGILLSGGSMANQTAIVCARTYGRPDTGGVAYLSPRAHHSVHKGLRLSGIDAAETRTMPADRDGHIDVAALRTQLVDDQRHGLRPWIFVAVAGDTDCGAVDPLEALAELAHEQDVWLHVDAAYGGFFMLTDRGAERMRGIGAASSVTLDAHKGLFLPYGIGALIVARPGALGRAHQAHGAYHRDIGTVAMLPHYFERGPENTRPFRGLLAWLPLQLHGVRRFRDALDNMLDLAREAADRLGRLPAIEVSDEPELSITTFRSTAGDVSTQAILDALNGTGRFHISSTTIDGRVTIRLAFLHPRTDHATLDDLLAVVEGAAQDR